MNMDRFLRRAEAGCYTLLRIVAGVLYATHGLQKLFGLFGGHPVALASQHGAGAIIETVCGTLIAVGLFTGYAAFLASGEMAVAYFQFHAPRAFWPLVNRGEVPALNSFLFLYVASRGTGIFGLDRHFGRMSRR
jgi:putative oxidoreductase